MVAPVFSGALVSKKKQEIQDIALALKLSDGGTKDEIMNRIKRHLELNPDLEEDPSFSGLFGSRRKRSVQPQPLVTHPHAKPNSRGRRAIALDSVRELTPINDLHDVSVFLKNPSSPYDETPEQSLQQAMAITPSSLPPLLSSPVKSIVQCLSATPNAGALTLRIKGNDLLQNSVELLAQFRGFISDSQNVWYTTTVMEAIYVTYTVIPWKMGKVPLFEMQDMNIALPYVYPPLSTFQTYAFWMVIIHWALPAIVFPLIAGGLISFTPKALSRSPTSDVPHAMTPFDPLTAAIIRLAVQVNYPYASIPIQGVDVLGWNWRVWNAVVMLLFAFSERLGVSPQATAEIIQVERRKERLQLEASASTPASPSSRRKAIASPSQFSDEVD